MPLTSMRYCLRKAWEAVPIWCVDKTRFANAAGAGVKKLEGYRCSNTFCRAAALESALKLRNAV